MGSEIVQQLLAEGYDVVATARSVGDNDSNGGGGGGRCSHLVALASVLPGTLELQAADLLKKGSFNEAAKGCDFIFHAAGVGFRLFFGEGREGERRERECREVARDSADVFLFALSPQTIQNKYLSSLSILATSDPQRELLDPALCGTVSLLSSAAKENERRRNDGGGDGSRKGRRPLRVVLTSSVAAVHGEYEAPPKKGSFFSEEDWNVSKRG